MSHKIVFLKSNMPYMGTSVPFDRSLLQIQAMLEKHGCREIYTKKELNNLAVKNQMRELPFISLLFRKDGIPYLIDFPIVYETTARSGDRLRMDASARIIHDRIKALLIEQELGLLDFSQAMMQFLALSDGQGGVTTMQEKVMDSHQQLQGGRFDFKLMLPEAKS